MALLETIENLAIISSLALIYRVIMARIRHNTVPVQLLIGLLFGLFTILGMMTPFTMIPGVFYDGRSIILSLAGLFCGPITTAVAAVIAGIYRASLGGGGVYAGVGTVIEASTIGLIFFHLRKTGKIQVNAATLIILGVLVHIGMLLLQLTIPGGVGWRVWQEIGVYVMVFFTAVTLVMGLLFLDSENQLKDRKALVKSENTLKKAQQLARVGSWVWRLLENQLEGSEELYQILGFEKGIINRKVAEGMTSRIHPDDREAVKAIGEKILAGEPPALTEFRLIMDDGSYRTLWSETGEILRDSKGQVTAASGIVQDITERRAIESELLENEARYRSLIMNSPDAIFVNHEDRIALVNNKAMELFGAMDASELLGKPALDFFHPDYHETIMKRIKLLRGTELQSLPVSQEQIIRIDGRVVDVDVISATFHFHGGEDIHVILRDITERKRMEQELRDSHDLLARLADSVPGVVFQLHIRPDGEMFFPFTSPGIRKIDGLTPDMLAASADPALDRIHPEDRILFEKEIQESARALRELYAEFRMNISDQDYRWFQCSAKPERADDGGTLWSGILSDITDRKMDEQKIADQLDELHRWQTVMLGREKRAIELKQEVNTLLVELGRPPRYQYTGTKRPHGGVIKHDASGLDDLPEPQDDEDGGAG